MKIDVSEMSAKALQELQENVQGQLNILNEIQKEKTRQKLGITLDSLQAQYDEFLEEAQTLGGKIQVTLDVPILFEINVTASLENTYDYEECYRDDIFGKHITGKLGKNDFSKKQAKLLNQAIKDFTYRACGEIYDLFPDTFAEHEEFAKRFQKFLKQVKASKFTVSEIQEIQGD